MPTDLFSHALSLLAPVTHIAGAFDLGGDWQLLLGTFRAARRGEFGATDSALEGLLGWPPQTMREVLVAAMP